MLIDPYHPGKPFQNFKDLDTKLNQYYDIIDDFLPNSDTSLITPRYRYEHGFKTCSRDIFYYIDKLYDKNPSSVIDVGCGECVWKKFFPNIIGFDPTPSVYSDYDFVDYFDENFCQGHKENWDCGMALNSIHFIPWPLVSDQIKMAMGLIKKGGRFLFTFNFKVLDNYTKESIFPKKASYMEQIDYMDMMISAAGFDIVMLDYPYLQGVSEKLIEEQAFINGTVRFILEK
jgi:hypothetical protein